jgi:hypothetical protein
MLKALVDPTKAPLRSMPKSERDLSVTVANAWAPAFDNLSGITPATADALCRISTGGGISARQLYTDTDEIILEFMRPLLLNGIDDLATRPDLAERALVLHLPAMDPSRRTDEAQLWQRFDEASPRILGAILDCFACALRRYESTHVPELPRMADFARWVSAAEQGLGWSPGAAMGAYRQHRQRLDRETMERDPVASLVPLLPNLRSGSAWSGHATSLLGTLNALAAERETRSATWPKTASALGIHLKRIAPLLRSNGYEVTFDRTASERTMVIARSPSSPSSPS